MQTTKPVASRSPASRHPLFKAACVAAGLILLGVGIVGFLVPGLPGTPLLLVAAWLFSMSNERLHRWTTTNKWFGRPVADYQAGLGIRRRVKVVSVVAVTVVVSYSVFVALDALWSRLAVAGLGLYGIWFILTRPTRERVEKERVEAA